MPKSPPPPPSPSCQHCKKLILKRPKWFSESPAPIFLIDRTPGEPSPRVIRIVPGQQIALVPMLSFSQPNTTHWHIEHCNLGQVSLSAENPNQIIPSSFSPSCPRKTFNTPACMFYFWSYDKSSSFLPLDETNGLSEILAILN